MQHVELVELQQVDHPPDLPDREEGAGHVERQAAPGVPRRVQDPRGRHPEFFGAGRHQLEQRGQAAGDAGRFRRAQHDPAVLDQQRVAFGGRVAAVRREAGRRGQPARFGRGAKLDRDGRLIRCLVAVDGRQPQACPAGDLGAEPPGERRDRSIGVRDHRARPEGEPGPVPGVEARRGRYDRVVHRAGATGRRPACPALAGPALVRPALVRPARPPGRSPPRRPRSWRSARGCAPGRCRPGRCSRRATWASCVAAWSSRDASSRAGLPFSVSASVITVYLPVYDWLGPRG